MLNITNLDIIGKQCKSHYFLLDFLNLEVLNHQNKIDISVCPHGMIHHIWWRDIYNLSPRFKYNAHTLNIKLSKFYDENGSKTGQYFYDNDIVSRILLKI